MKLRNCFRKAIIFVLTLSFGVSALANSAYARTQEDKVDELYLESLKEAGFPSSYRKKLLALHKMYPKWEFEAVITGLKWDEVLLEESVNGRNLVHISADDGMKSTAKGAYDWSKDRFTIFDGSSWVAAHPEYIAYIMDPRNALNETDIFQFETMSYSASQKKAVVRTILRGTFMEKDIKDSDGKLINYTDTFMKVAKLAKVSPYLLATRVRQEQGSGTSELISGKNKKYKGYYNYFNFGAYGKTKEEVVLNGLKFAKAQGWDSRYKSILGGAKLLANNYIARGQDTLYFQKFNVVDATSLYKHQYMTNVSAAISEGRNVAKSYVNKNQTYVFRIPVYKSMPSKAVAFTRKGNPNNYLRSISVDLKNEELEPIDLHFARLTQNYEIVVPPEVSELEILATAVSSKSELTGTGMVSVKEGENTFRIKCKSQKGVIRTYKLKVFRKPISD